MWSPRHVATAAGVLWGAATFLMGIANLAFEGYGLAFLQFLASMYPGYEVGGLWSVIVATLYAAIDGAIAGAVFAWLYNKLAYGGAGEPPAHAQGAGGE